MKICIIDDDPICHFIATKMIEKVCKTPELSYFKNGKEAIDFFTDQQFHPEKLPELLLVDINMPVVNGWNFVTMLEELNIEHYNPSIFICSSSIDSQDLAKAKAIDCVEGYLNKPLNPLMLQNCIAKHTWQIH